MHMDIWKCTWCIVCCQERNKTLFGSLGLIPCTYILFPFKRISSGISYVNTMCPLLNPHPLSFFSIFNRGQVFRTATLLYSKKYRLLSTCFILYLFKICITKCTSSSTKYLLLVCSYNLNIAHDYIRYCTSCVVKYSLFSTKQPVLVHRKSLLVAYRLFVVIFVVQNQLKNRLITACFNNFLTHLI